MEVTTVYTSVYFTVWAECIDKAGNTVERALSNVRGMTDNGQPAWTEHGPSRFVKLEEAKASLAYAQHYSSYNSQYRGGKTWIEKVTHVTTNTTETVKLEPAP